MNQKNLEYLQDQVKYTGFGEALANEIATNIEQGQPEFKINYETQYGNDSVNATLNFSQSKQSDMYFFNTYQVDLQKENEAEKMSQTFYINKENNITLKEAYNLMCGRSVNKYLTNKDGQIYNAWLQMDFKNSDERGNFKLKHYHENYGFDLDGALAKHPIKELNNDSYKDNLIDSLKKGNLQSVTFIKNGEEAKHYVEASPQFKTINVYSNGQRLESGQKQSEKEVEGKSNTIKQSDKNKLSASSDDDPGVPEQKNKRKRQTPSV